MADHQLFDKNELQSKKHEAELENVPETPTFDNQMMGLHTALGNQGVQRMLSGNTTTTGPSTFIQAKMVVGAADDTYEQEADRVAQEIVNTPVQRVEAVEEEELQAKRIQREEMPEEELQAKRIQRVEAVEEEELQAKRIQREEMPEEEELQAKRVQRASEDMSGSFEVGEDIESSIQAKKGGGTPLPESTRSTMESHFGQDFSNVKVHTDSESDSLNRSVQARAFTTGSDVFFRQGEFNPESSSGKELLAHELTHVVQQGGSSPKTEGEEG
jgi:hypothetical protein